MAGLERGADPNSEDAEQGDARGSRPRARPGRSAGSSGDRLFHAETASHPGARLGDDEQRVVDHDDEAGEDGSANVATVVHSGGQQGACAVRRPGARIRLASAAPAGQGPVVVLLVRRWPELDEAACERP
jgi:hypothetical protein